MDKTQPTNRVRRWKLWKEDGWESGREKVNVSHQSEGTKGAHVGF